MDLYCKVYLKIGVEQDEVKLILSRAFGVKFEGRATSIGSLAIDLFKNKGAALVPDESSRAVDWPYYLEIEPVGHVEEEGFVNAIASLLEALRRNQISVTASCDFEDQLAKAS